MRLFVPHAFQKGAASLLDLVFPPRCVACGREGAFFCESCIASAPAKTEPTCLCTRPLDAPGLCSTCRQQGSPLEGVLSPYLLDGTIRQAVHGLKYSNLRALAPVLGDILATYLENVAPPSDVLVPVPLHSRRLRQRGYNQAELLAREVGRHLGTSVAPKGLARVKHSQPQARAENREERRANVAEAFLAVETFDGMRVLLVDDVCTTGATLEACASAVRQAGAREVWGATLARER